MLLKLYCREHGFHHPSNFRSGSKIPKEDELIIYTW